MQYKNFLISGSGRTGTKFLAQLMNHSEKWTVLHEPPPQSVENNTIENLDVVQEVFNRDYYGEVNSMRRKIILDLDVEKRGVIIRNPYEIWVSIANRKLTTRRKINRVGGRLTGTSRVQVQVIKPEQANVWLDEMHESLKIIHAAIQDGVYPIYFHKMIKDVNYMQTVLSHFGIEDIKVTENLIQTKINASPREVKYKSIDDIIESDKARRICEWFYDIYFKGKF